MNSWGLLLLLLPLLLVVTVSGWHGIRLPDAGCTNTGSMRCHAGGYQNSKLQGLFNRYQFLFNLHSGATALPESTGRFSLGLHSHDPLGSPLLIKMLNETGQVCTDANYCTLQTWWEKVSPRVHMVVDTARLLYTLTPSGDPFPYYDMPFNESVSQDQLNGASYWDQTVSAAYQGYTSVADLLDCDTPIIVEPFLVPILDVTSEECEALTNNDGIPPWMFNTTNVLPFNATSMLPMSCARLPLPSYLYDDLVSNVGAHDLRTAYDLLYQQQEIPGGLPGTQEFLTPSTQLTHPWQGYLATYQYAGKAQQRHKALATPPCSTGTNPDTLDLSHYYKIGPWCQLYQVSTAPQWLFRVNITLTFDRTQVHPAMAQLVGGQTGADYEVQMSWWLRWDGNTITVDFEGDVKQNPVINILRHFIDMRLANLIQLDDSKHRFPGPTMSGYIVACGSQLDSALGLAINPWTQTPWLSKPSQEWYFPVPSPGFLRTGWTDNQWNNETDARLLAPYRPGMWYWVNNTAALTEFGPACGQVGARGPCPNDSSSLDNPYGPLYAFERLNEFSRNTVHYDDFPQSSLTDHSPYLPPLANAWFNELKPRSWVAAHNSINIPLSLVVEPTSDLLTELFAEFSVHVSDRLANPRQFPLHRRSASNSTSQLPLRNIYRQNLNTTVSQCLIQWYNLSHAFTQDHGNLTSFIQNLQPPSPGTVVGAIHAHFCDPEGLQLPASQRQPRRYIETWVCGPPTGSDVEPPLIFRAGSPGDALFTAASWDARDRCKASEPRMLFSNNAANATAAHLWWKNIAQTAQDQRLVRFEVARCRVQLTDPDADPQVALFPDADSDSQEMPARLPSQYRQVAETLENTISCFIQVAVDEAALIAKANGDTVAAAHEALQDTKAQFYQSYYVFFYIILAIIGALVLASAIMFIILIVKECQKPKKNQKQKTS